MRVKLDSWIYISAISLAFSIPGLLFSYYSVILFLSTFRYPKSLGDEPPLQETPVVSILIATFNEKFVVASTLDALKSLDYPRDRLQVVVADDSSDETVDVIDGKLLELNNLDVLLLDADSTVKPDVLKRGLNAASRDPRIGFVSFRVGHYNREQNLTTRLFALQQDQGDTVAKMGAYSIDAPY